MDDYMLILNRLNEIESIMSNVYYEGKPLNYSNGFNQKDAFRLAKEASKKEVIEQWMKLHS